MDTITLKKKKKKNTIIILVSIVHQKITRFSINLFKHREFGFHVLACLLRCNARVCVAWCAHTRHARSERSSRVTRTTKEKAWSDVRILRRQEECCGVCFHGSRVRKQGKALFKFEKKNRGTSRAVSNGHSCVSIGRDSHVRITPFSDNDAKGLDAWCSVGFDPRTREDVVRSFAGDETSSEVRLTFLASPDIGNINCYGTIGVRVGSCRIVGRRENRTW